jgi:surface polysaccharide O-acyltransferase-like enzyme
MKKYISLFIALTAITAVQAQGSAQTGDIFADHLKIYTCVAVLSIILGFIFFFLFSLEKRLKKLEEGK